VSELRHGAFLDRLKRKHDGGPTVYRTELEAWGVQLCGDEARLDGRLLDPSDVLIRLDGKTYVVARPVWEHWQSVCPVYEDTDAIVYPLVDTP